MIDFLVHVSRIFRGFRRNGESFPQNPFRGSNYVGRRKFSYLPAIISLIGHRYFQMDL